MEDLAIIVCSSAMLVYWFRYTCSLLLQRHLRTGEEEPGTRGIASTWIATRKATAQELDSILLALDADYRMVNYLLGQMRTAQPASVRRLLRVDYRILHLWCAVARRLSQRRAQRALEEMALVVACLGGALEPARTA